MDTMTRLDLAADLAVGLFVDLLAAWATPVAFVALIATVLFFANKCRVRALSNARIRAARRARAHARNARHLHLVA